MAESNSNLAQDVNDIVSSSYQVESLLHGALSLLEQFDDDTAVDGDGRLFHARQIIELAVSKTAEIYLTEDSKKIIERVKGLQS